MTSLRKIFINGFSCFGGTKSGRRAIRNILDALILDRKRENDEEALQGVLLQKLNRELGNFTIRYSNDFPKIVWQYWGQGKGTEPVIIKKCFESVDKFLEPCGFKIIRLDNDSICNYLGVESLLENIGSKKGFTYTAFSDLARCGLLYQYGGIWLDASIFLSGIPKVLLSNNMVLFERDKNSSIREKILYMSRNNYFRWGRNVRVNWLSSVIKAPKEDPLFGLMWKVLSRYWEEESEYTNYFLAQILFDLIKNRSGILNNLMYIMCNDLYPHQLQFMLQNKVDANKINKLLCDTTIHKLTYKLDDRICKDQNNVFNYILRI